MEGEANEKEVFLLARRIKNVLTYWGIPAIIASTSQSFFGETILRVISQHGFWFGISVGLAVGFVVAVATIQFLKKLRPNTTGVGVSIGESMRIIASGFTKESLFVGISVFFIISVIIVLANSLSGPIIAGIVGTIILLLILLVRGAGLAESIAANLLSSGMVRTDVPSQVVERYSDQRSYIVDCWWNAVGRFSLS